MTRDPDLHGSTPAAYVVARIQQALAADPRVGELGIVVAEEEPGLVVLKGSVSTASRKGAVATVARQVMQELGDERRVRDDTTVPSARAPDGEETLA
jgi:hypothetical protein